MKVVCWRSSILIPSILVAFACFSQMVTYMFVTVPPKWGGGGGGVQSLKLGNAWESAPVFAELRLPMGAEAACCEETSFAVDALLRQRVSTNWVWRRVLTARSSAADGRVA